MEGRSLNGFLWVENSEILRKKPRKPARLKRSRLSPSEMIFVENRISPSSLRLHADALYL